MPLDGLPFSAQSLTEGILNTAHCVIVCLDADGAVLYCNPYFEEISGYGLPELKGRNWFELFARPGETERLRKLFQRAIGGIHTRGNIVSIRTRNRDVRHIEWHDTTLMATGDAQTMLLAVGNDFTEHLNAERELAFYRSEQQELVAKRTQELVETRNRLAQEIDQKNRLLEKLGQLAIRDALTGVYNRTEMDRRLAEETARAGRHRHRVAVFMLDVDHFKTINDRLGHRAGDAALKRLVNVLEENLRLSDYLARYGGEEFLVILPETKPLKAIELAERLRRVVAQSPLDLPDSRRMPLTVSIGVAAFPDHAVSPAGLIEAADRALYAAKAGGRNRVEMAAAGVAEAKLPAALGRGRKH